MLKKLFCLLSLLVFSAGAPSLAQNIGVGYKSDGSDVSGDFAESEGDGGSVSADVTVGFNIGKTIAIAIKQPDGSFTNNPMFYPTTGVFDPAAIPASTMWLDNPDFSSYGGSWPNLTKSRLTIYGAIYSNTDVSITIDPSKEFVNAEDPTSRITARHAGLVQDTLNNSGVASTFHMGAYDDNSSTSSVFPATGNVSVSDFNANGGVLLINFWSYLYRDTIDATDRSGNYYSTITFTVTAM